MRIFKTYGHAAIGVMTEDLYRLARDRLDTAVTRGKRLVVLIGQREAIRIAVRGGTMTPRRTKLRAWLSAR